MLSDERDGEEDGRPGTTEAVGRGERGGPDGLERAGEDEDEPVHDDFRSGRLVAGRVRLPRPRARLARSRANPTEGHVPVEYGVSGARPGVLSSAGALLRTEDRHEP